MNWVNWNGNGLVMMKEISMIEAAWRFCKKGLHSVAQAVAVPAAANQVSVQPQYLFKRDSVGAPSFPENTVIQSAQSQHVQPTTPEAIANEVRAHMPRPMGALTEIRSYSGADSDAGCRNSEAGEEQNGLQQLLPALAGFCRDRWLVLVSPPRRPNVAELTAAGIDPARVLLVHAHDSNGLGSKGLKVVEQALRSGNCGAVLAWLQACDVPTLQRLRRAAVAGQAWGVMFREGGIEGHDKTGGEVDSETDWDAASSEAEVQCQSDLAMQAEQQRFVSSNTSPKTSLIENSQQSVAQVVSIHSGLAKASGYVSENNVVQESETTQLEMAIN